MFYTPKRGDLIWTNFDPSSGHEQAHRRPAIILSPEDFNQNVRLALVAPITSRIRGHGFEVNLEKTKTKGVVLCQQVRTIDFNSRGAEFIEKIPTVLLNKVLAKVRILVN